MKRRQTVGSLQWIRILVLCLAVFAGGPAWAMDGDAEGILAVGTASLSRGNQAEARSSALSRALENGVVAYLLGRIEDRILAENLDGFMEELVPAAVNEIANYNILGEAEKGEEYRLLVRLRVNGAAVEKHIKDKGFSPRQERAIHILFMVAVWEPGSPEPSFWWKAPEGERDLQPVELALQGAFEAMGYMPVGRACEAALGENASEPGNSNLTDEEAAAWGRGCGSDVVVTGAVVIEKDMVSIHLKAVDSSTGRLLSSQGAQVSVAAEGSSETDPTDAIQSAVRQVAERLGPEIRGQLDAIGKEPDKVFLTLQGISGFSQLRQFTDFLRQGIPGVRSVSQTRFKGEQVDFEIACDEGVDSLFKALNASVSIPFSVSFHMSEDGVIIAEIR